MSSPLALPAPGLASSPPGPASSPDHDGPGDPRLARSLASSTAEGVCAEVVNAAAGGATLTAWAIHVGFGPVGIGALGALPYLSLLVHLPAAWITSARGHRRVALWAVALSRQAYLPLAALPLLGTSRDTSQTVLLAVASVTSVLAVVGNNAWVAWMADLVPASIRGRYFGRRTAVCALAGTIASLGAAGALDVARPRGAACVSAVLGALAFAATVAGAASTVLMARQHDPGAPERPALELRAALAPLGDGAARRLIAYQVAWNAAVGMAAPFFTLHELQNLGMSYVLVATHLGATAGVRMLAAPLWGRAIDRYGERPVLVCCSFGIAVVPAIWLLPTPDFLWPIALDALLAGVLWGGHGLASFALPLSLAPRRGRPFYLAAFSAAGGLAFAAASATGGLAARSLPVELHLRVLGRPMFALQALFVASALARLGAAGLAVRIVQPDARSRPVGELLAAGRTAGAAALRPLGLRLLTTRPGSRAGRPPRT